MGAPSKAVRDALRIAFRPEMVAAILRGEKTQTRRILDFRDPDRVELVSLARGFATFRDLRLAGHVPIVERCYYGAPGGLLWVAEEWREKRPRRAGKRGFADIEYAATPPPLASPGRFNAAHAMPRWASRLTLELVELRVERVQSITEEDARAEGVRVRQSLATSPQPLFSARAEFRGLWDAIHGRKPRRSWEANPWVWALTFRRLEGP